MGSGRAEGLVVGSYLKKKKKNPNQKQAVAGSIQETKRLCSESVSNQRIRGSAADPLSKAMLCSKHLPMLETTGAFFFPKEYCVYVMM